MSLWTLQNETLSLNFHPGQSKAWKSDKRFVFVLAGTQSGKTSFLPFQLYKWIQETATPDGNNDYIATTASYDLFKLKFLPEMRNVFEHLLGAGRYWSGERIIELKDPAKGFWAKRVDDPMYGRIILRSAASPSGLESATAKAAIMDEAGQDEYTLETWEAVLRRLSLHQGRVCAATTLYNLGWIKSEIYDAWRNGDKDIDVIQFASVQNPAFPKAEFERARSKMQDWRFAMFYLGQFAKPAGLIYSAFTDDMLVDPIPLPDHWERVIGVDFGGANTATLWLAQDPDSEIWYAYRETLEGDKSTQEHVDSHLEYLGNLDYTVVGGAGSETQYRMDWTWAGLPVQEPPIKEVENGIDKVTELMKTNKFRVFRSLSGLRDELGSYRRKLDDSGNPTEEILNKRAYHRCFVAGTLVSTIGGDKPIEQIKVGDLVLTRFGYKPVAQRHTSKAIVRPYLFSNGKMLIATPDHPVYVTGKGYIELQALRYYDTIETSNKYKEMFQCQRLLSLTAQSIIAILNPRINQSNDITTDKGSTFIEQYGNSIMDQSQRVVTFITRMVTRLIMTSQTLNVLAQRTIRFITYLNGLINSGKRWTTPAYLPQSGIGQKRAGSGTGKLVNYLGKMQSRLNWYARTAKENLRLWLDTVILSFVPMLASPHIGGSLKLMMKQGNADFVEMNLKQTSTVRLDIVLESVQEQVEVYNLSVETNEYFANDILVHNCDGLRYACTYINQPIGEIEIARIG